MYCFILIPTQYCGLDGILFYYERKYLPLDVTVNFIILFLEGLILPISQWHGIINTFEPVVFLLELHKFLSETNRYKNLKMK